MNRTYSGITYIQRQMVKQMDGTPSKSVILVKLGIWFFQFLTNRTHYVRIPGGISKDSPVLGGVPQGTVLGPLLFLIMISDVNKGTTSSKLVSFADDTRVYSNIAESDDCDNLQYDLS